MADFEPRTVNFRVLGATVLMASLAFFAICFIGMLASRADNSFWPMAFVLSILGCFVGAGVYTVSRLLQSIESNTYKTEEAMGRLMRHIDHVREGVDALNENILLSEDAKAIAFRDKDLQALRQKIQEKIDAKDWEAALYLVEQMSERFGSRQEAEHFRTRITQERQELRQQDVAMAIARFNDRLGGFEWDQAAEEIQKIKADFPDAPEVVELIETLEQAKTARKKELIRQWDQAIQNNEIDRSIEILKELDRYLTANEAAAFEESARGAFRAKLHNLGVQFSLLVAEKVWDKALQVGLQIVNEFPNSRMAQEIQERLETLKAKAKVTKI
jgi:outer membrane protein assembly factor BamD (BamD/ComL family)